MKKADSISELFEKLKNNSISRKELDILLDSIEKSETAAELKSAFYQHWHSLEVDGPQEGELELYERQFTKVFKKAQEKEQELLKGRKKPYKWYSVAAAVVILISAYSLFYFSRKEQVDTQIEAITWIEKQTARGQNLIVRLPDGSKIRLNAESKIRFPNKFTSGKREVVLEGEGFFEVEENPNLPFVVTTGEVNTTVLGTSFNVRSYIEESTVQIAVKTGKVAVSDKNQELILTPNQVATYDNQKHFVMEEKDISSLIAWTDGGFIFDQKPLEEITAQLERRYDVDITIDDPALKRIRITLKQKGESLTTVLNILSKSGGFDYEIKGKNVLFKSKEI
ncbi:DUF4974 domain-containing protein [Fulvivirgaceae bacterium BMA10]|uniref:DUF4974 domain-containing protein n=1 Tax=Splendidivirga corallicola TaxID=3051826 RepID=A0ABT8KU19_9BACT|nr:DUF4974 domain-containing protein [Fulvivirgaceae bacterium BMA10]